MPLNKKRSFFERLSGSVPADDYDAFDDDLPIKAPVQTAPSRSSAASIARTIPDDDAEGQLPVDVYQSRQR
jgi:hypothetical protein